MPSSSLLILSHLISCLVLSSHFFFNSPLSSPLLLYSYDTLITIYNSLIQPSFDYCDLVWDNLSKGLATRLQKLQNMAGRVILRAAYDVSSEDVLKELGWSDLKTRRAKHKATQMFKISTGEASNYLTDRFFKVEARNPYNIRNSELNINLPLPKTDFTLVLNCGISCLIQLSRLKLLQPLKDLISSHLISSHLISSHLISCLVLSCLVFSRLVFSCLFFSPLLFSFLLFS